MLSVLLRMTIMPFFISLMLISCSQEHMSLSDLESPGDEDISFSEVYTKILQPKCSTCHSGAGAPKGLDMITENSAFENLVNQSSQDRSTVLRVSPENSNPESSYLIAKIISDDTSRDNSRMPLGGPYLEEEDINFLKEWINSGAKR